jgi:hypothetical protein
MSRFGYLTAAAILIGFVVPASADTIANFTLDGVTFNDGGTATGGFTLDLTTSTLSNVNITTSQDSVLGLGTTYSSGTFSNFPDATFVFSNGFFLQFEELTIVVSELTPGDLSGSNSFTIATASSYEIFFSAEMCEGPCSVRSITDGSLDDSATPLPAALPLFATGVGVIGLLARRRKRKNVAAIAAA